jgi:hypothetical protein
MENEINIGDQNVQQVGQNPVNQPVQIPEKPKVNCWMILTIVLLIVVISGGFYIASLRNQLNIASSSQNNERATQSPTILSPTNTPVPTIQTVVTEQPKVEWVRKQFANSWDLEYPKNWEVNEAGLIEGNINLKGEYSGVSYTLGLGYPIFIGFNPPGIPENLDIWVNNELSFIPQDKKAAIKIVNTSVAGTTAKKVFNLPEKIFDDGKTRKYSENLIDEVYIWRQGERNPSTIILKQNQGILDSGKAEAFLDIFLSKIK